MIYKVKPNAREKGIEAHLVKMVKERGGLCKKIGNEGWPDRLVILPGGVLYFVETKSKTGKLSALQRHIKDALELLGMVVHVPRSKEEINNLLGFVTLRLTPYGETWARANKAARATVSKKRCHRCGHGHEECWC